MTEPGGHCQFVTGDEQNIVAVESRCMANYLNVLETCSGGEEDGGGGVGSQEHRRTSGLPGSSQCGVPIPLARDSTSRTVLGTH